MSQKRYLICDVDDCLIKTDLLLESWILLIKKSPSAFLFSLLILFKGKLALKKWLAERINIEAHLLPYRPEVIKFIQDRKKQGDILVIASASPWRWVEAVANYLGLFDHIIASENVNTKGAAKLSRIREITGNAPFTYIGDSFADIPIWNASQEAVLVNPSALVRKSVQASQVTVIEDSKNIFRGIRKQIRVYQWVKNALVFLPVMTSHQLSQTSFINGVIAFFSFSFVASFVYVLNDVLDIPSDRNHHSKKNRPFASGDLGIRWAFVLMPSLLVLSLGLSLLLPQKYMMWILIYLALNVAYSFYLKQTVIIDILILASMYTLRIYAGSAATGIEISSWLLIFSTLFFFSLACVKRYVELVRSQNKITSSGRGYRQVDAPIVQSIGVGSGLISVLIILFYARDPQVMGLYKNQHLLWLWSPIFLFWISRIWLLANRNEVADDPILFAVKDRISWISAFFILIVGFLAI